MARTESLVLAKNLRLPVDGVTQTYGFIARKGGGKSYAAGKLAEEMTRLGAQTIVLDPIGNWWGLRLAADGKARGIDIPLFGGLRGDLPLRAEAGSLIADVVVDTGTSAILDVSQFRKGDRKRFVADFLEQLFDRRKAAPSAMHVFLEEAQLFAPQQCGPDERRMLGAVEDIVRLGRNFGIGSSMITQRPQSVNKEVLNQVECLVLLQISGAHERKAIEDWVRYKGLEIKKMVDELPSLDIGEAFVWSPQWLRIFERLRIGQKWTYDSTATPKVGASQGKTRNLRKLDLEALESAMATIVEQVKANDPAQLKREIARLERELAAGAKSRSATVSADERKAIEATGYARAHADIAAKLRRAQTELETALRRVQPALGDVLSIAQMLGGILAKTSAPAATPRGPRAKAVVEPKRPAPLPKAHRPVHTVHLPPAKQRILDALAWFEAVGINQPDRVQLAFMAGTKPGSGAYNNNLGNMRTEGLVEYPTTGKVCLTDAGRQQARPPETPRTSEALQTMIFAKLPPAKVRILKALIEHGRMTRDDLATTVGSSPGSGAFNNNLGSLRTLGVLDYPSPGDVEPTTILFLD